MDLFSGRQDLCHIFISLGWENDENNYERIMKIIMKIK